MLHRLSKRVEVEAVRARGRAFVQRWAQRGMLACFAIALPLAALDLAGIGSNIWSIALLVLGFSLVIFVHELGHFLAAKWAGVRVERFAIGFGKELFGFTKGETRYSWNVLPLGGYVKMLGQEDFVVDKAGELKVKHDPTSFTNKSIGKRMVIVSAGVIMNLLFAAIAFGIVEMVGRMQPPAVVGVVVPNSPAGRAGLLTGDRIIAINGRPLQSFNELTSAIVLSDVDEPLVLDVERDGKPLLPKPMVTPEYRKEQSVRQLGVGPGMNRRIALPSFWPKETYGPDEVHADDELFKLVVNGEAKEFKDLGVYERAMAVARGKPIDAIVKRPKDAKALTQEQLLAFDPQIEATEVPVRIQAMWVPLSHESDEAISGSLLGLVPRLTVLLVDEKKTFEKAGVQNGDVIVKIGGESFPSYDAVKRTIEQNPGNEVPIEVARPFTSNHGLSGAAVGLLVQNRETLIAAARESVEKAAKLAADLTASAGLPKDQSEKILAKLKEAGDARALRRWLENVDVHVLSPVVPNAPFVLLGKTPPPPVDASLRCLDEQHLVVADVLPKLGSRPSPAAEAGIPDGAVILSVDGKPVRQWYELTEAFREKAGKKVEIAYRVADETHKTTMSIPGCIVAQLNLPAGTRITSIDGKTSAAVEIGKDEMKEVGLPDWRAVAAILEGAVGKTVPVEWVTNNGEKGRAEYAVTKDNTDPWLLRAFYSDSFACYQLWERHPISNPFLAVAAGFRQAYLATVATVKSIQHMLFTRQVGFDKVSGPVGIFRLGSRAADLGMIQLLWFLAVISANLAVINFLPMPIVDGGLFLFLILEKIRGEPVSIKTQVATQLIGIALIATLFILVTYQDIKNWILGA